MKQEFVPVWKWHTTTKYNGTGDVKPLPVTRSMIDHTLNSVWVLPSFWQRLCFLFSGELTLRIYGTSQPPVAIVAGDIFGRKP
jgi:hypothetical protein